VDRDNLQTPCSVTQAMTARYNMHCLRAPDTAVDSGAVPRCTGTVQTRDVQVYATLFCSWFAMPLRYQQRM